MGLTWHQNLQNCCLRIIARALGLLLLHADKHYHVREIARLTDTVAGTGERSEGLFDAYREFTAKRQSLVKSE